jgi:hypothetical protein
MADIEQIWLYRTDMADIEHMADIEDMADLEQIWLISNRYG